MAQAVFASERNGRIHQHYMLARGDRAMPRREDIDPGQIRRELPFIYIVDTAATEAGLRFRFRLMGTELADLLKQNGTGKFVIELDLGGWQDEWRKSLLLVTEARNAVVSVDKLRLPNGLTIEIEHLAMPLSSDGETVDRVIGAIDFLGYEHCQAIRAFRPVDFGELEGIEVPKRLVVADLAIDPEPE